MGEFSSSGYIRERLDEWVTNVKSIYTGIFGSSYDLSGDTQDGELVAAFSEALSNEDQKCESVAQAFNPATAEGESLSALVKINGVERAEATYTVVNLSLTGTDGVSIPSGSLVRDTTTDEQFATDSDVTISAGVASVSATALTAGAITASAGNITTIDTNIFGWSTVVNDNDATTGEDEETDAELRIRRRAAVAASSTGNVDSVNGAILNLDGVIISSVRENDTDTTDADGITAHSIAVIVQGGDTSEVAETIFINKSAGCVTYAIGGGAVTEEVIDSQGFGHDINFARPEDEDIYIDIAVTALTNFPADGEDQIKEAIVDYFENDDDTLLLIGDNLIYSEVYVPIMSVTGVSVTSLYTGLTASPTGTADIDIDFYKLARFDTSRITITVT